MVGDEVGGQVQTQEEQDGQQEVDDMKEGSPLHGELRGEDQGSGDKMTTKMYEVSYSCSRITFCAHLLIHETLLFCSFVCRIY